MRTNAFVSYAQNAEDVVLWRALGHVTDGTFVDVGAAEPIEDSVTYAFYERGWRGINIEPVAKLADALRRVRPADETVQVAAGSAPGRTTLFVAEGTGRSTVIADLAAANDTDGLTAVETEIEVRTLDEILAASRLSERPITFCKVDVEGAEADVLAGLDLTTWRPWVLVVEATVPQRTVASHASWEASVIASGYSLCLFDGLNRFYIADEHQELADRLSYPACVFDQPYVRADVARTLERAEADLRSSLSTLDQTQHELAVVRERATSVRHELDAAAGHLADARRQAEAWRAESLTHVHELTGARRRELELHRDLELARARSGDLETLIDAMEHTVSWRVTTPLRAVRSAHRPSMPLARRAPSSPDDTDASVHIPDPSPDRSTISFATRLWQAAQLLRDERGDSAAPELTIGAALVAFEEAVGASSEPTPAKAWLALVATLARYPTDEAVQRTARVLRTDGPAGLIGELRRRFAAALDEGPARDVELAVIHGGVVADVSHTVANDLHTGIQRVVRETMSRWVRKHEITLINFDMPAGFAKELDASETERLHHWRDHLHTSGSDQVRREPVVRSDAVVVPWRSRLLLPELVAEPVRGIAYRGLARSGVLNGLGVIGFDLIPITAPETVAHGMPENFVGYLSVVRHATQVSAISGSTAHDFGAFASMLGSQGLVGPDVVAHRLPTEQPPKVDEHIARVRRQLGLGSLPLVLAVGSHEPRKNHIAVLEAAAALWRRGERFHLLMVGGSGWRAEEFDEYVGQLQAAGQPLSVWRRATEQDLWASYHLARFTVFPSLVEGYGLPIAESLACGTPVITSNFGSMAEVATRGGTVVVDPRDVAALERAMQSLLTDDVMLARLGAEASATEWGSWDDYADAVWRHLNGPVPA